MNYTDLGERIRRLRKEQHLTQEELAEKIGISTSFLGHIERGTRIASLDTLIAICNTLHATPNYLLEASLDHSYLLTGSVDQGSRERLSTLLRLAQDTVQKWDD